MEGLTRGLAWAAGGSITGAVIGSWLADDVAVTLFALILIFLALPGTAALGTLLTNWKHPSFNRREAVSACKILILLIITVSFSAMVAGSIRMRPANSSRHGISRAAVSEPDIADFFSEIQPANVNPPVDDAESILYRE